MCGIDIQAFIFKLKQDAVVLSAYQKQIILIVARIKPSSTIGSFIVEGFVRSLLNVANLEQVVQLLTLCEIHIIPMLNPDGVISGN